MNWLSDEVVIYRFSNCRWELLLEVGGGGGKSCRERGLFKNPHQHFYRPQTKFAKVMFSQVSVCPRGMGGLPHCMLGYTPRHPSGQITTSGQTHTPLGRHPSPCTVNDGIAGGTDPTGMHAFWFPYYFAVTCNNIWFGWKDNKMHTSMW